MQKLRAHSYGFTLIELSIVLVMIGLIVGGVLVGQSLISTASVRAEITQLQKFSTAVNTFRGKFGYLPGDIPATPAAQFGFMARAGTEGRGDGNGLVEGWAYGGTPTPSNLFEYHQEGETVFLWEDLSSANLIDGMFNTATDAPGPYLTLTSTPGISNYLPTAKIGTNNSVMVGVYNTQGGALAAPADYFEVGNVTIIDPQGNTTINPGLTVAQTYSIDVKIDDGLPVTGRVQARWGVAGATNFGQVNNATPASPTTCFDNNNVYEGTQKYSISQNNGAGMNCAVSVLFQ